MTSRRPTEHRTAETGPIPLWRDDLPPVPPPTGRHSVREPEVIYVDRFNWPPFISKWWFWLMITLITIGACGPSPREYDPSPSVDSGTSTTQTGDTP